MKLLLFVLLSSCAAFAPALRQWGGSSSALHEKYGGAAEEFNIPCDEDCSIEKYPNLPESVHPGVLSGKAMMDMLQHAKENGKLLSPKLKRVRGDVYFKETREKMMWMPMNAYRKSCEFRNENYQ